MDKMGGYAGSILKVDLTTKNIDRIPLSQELALKFLGGTGINGWLAYSHIEPLTAPFSPQNALVLGIGPLTGTLAPGAVRSNITAKSPVSQYIGSSGTGHMGMLKFAGYDHLIVTGKAETPVYLKIGDEVEIRDAGHLWGKDTWEATEAVWHELGKEYAVASIGPAGENLVRDANVMVNKYSAYADTGMGAVMGSKNLKAIAAYGSQGISVAEPKRFMELVNSINQEVMGIPNIEEFRTFGTLLMLEGMTGKTVSPVYYRNHQQVAGEEFLKSFDNKVFLEMMEQHGNLSCPGCPVGCKHFVRPRGGPYAGLAMPLSCAASPVEAFGGPCALEGGWIETFKCAELCNRLGMSYFSSANLIAMAIELYQRGIIDKKDTGGLDLEWQPGVVQDLLQRIAHRKGFGDILADGLIEAPRRIGRGADYYAIHCKGVGSFLADPRPLYTTLWATTVTHVTGGHLPPTWEYEGLSREKRERTLRRMGLFEDEMAKAGSGSGGLGIGRITRLAEDYTFALECFGMCTFPHNRRFNIDVWAEVYSAATGIEVSGAELLEAAARGIDMRKAFNIREGASRKDDTIPRRFLSEPIEFQGRICPPYDSEHLDKLVTEYYEARGWDPGNGAVTQQRLAELTG